MDLTVRIPGNTTPLTPTEANGLRAGDALEVVVGTNVTTITVSRVSKGASWTPNPPTPPSPP
jgi:hypothetical protein